MERNQNFRCLCCKEIAKATVQNQRYCQKKECQKERKNAWRRTKYASDIDYRLNQRDSTRAWLLSIGGCAAYYKNYRARQKLKHKDGNVTLSAKIDVDLEVANSDASFQKNILKSGEYIIRPICANSDALLVKIGIISRYSNDLQIST